MVIQRASNVLEESRKKIFDCAVASGGFGLGEMLVPCPIAQMAGVSSSDIFGAFKYYRAKILVQREDNKITRSLKKSKWSSLVGREIRLHRALGESSLEKTQEAGAPCSKFWWKIGALDSQEERSNSWFGFHPLSMWATNILV